MTMFTTAYSETKSASKLKTPYGVITAKGNGYDHRGHLIGEVLKLIMNEEEMQQAVDNKLYGIDKVDGKFIIEGACGVRSMQKIAAVGGWVIDDIHNLKGKLLGYQFKKVNQ